jgi:hypothetical protein
MIRIGPDDVMSSLGLSQESADVDKIKSLQMLGTSPNMTSAPWANFAGDLVSCRLLDFEHGDNVA